MSCPCDESVHPKPLRIAEGLPDLPRQVAGFAEYRAAMLSRVRQEPALADFRARSGLDLGLMLLEMWAVMCDAVSFYDQVHAGECYLRTAKLEPSVRSLIGLLGYVPRPAVSAQVELALSLEGTRPVTLRAGTAFRSGAFGEHAPQLFELTRDVTLHPAHNRFELVAPRAETAGAVGGPGSAPSALHLLPRGALVREGDVVLVAPAGAPATLFRPRVAAQVSPITTADGARYVRVSFSAPIALAASTRLEDVRIFRSTRKSALWTMPYEAGSTNPISGSLTQLVLEGLERSIRVGERVVLERAGELRWFRVAALSEVQQKIRAGTDGDGNTLYGFLPATRLTLDLFLNHASRKETGASWSSADADAITVHHGLVAAGTAAAPAGTNLSQSAALVLEQTPGPTEGVNAPARFALSDARGRSVLISGNIAADSGVLTRDGGDPGFQGALQLPVRGAGNIVSARRGETVAREVLGSGDSAQAYQRFSLKKSPLSYLPAASADSASGVACSLQLWVNGVKWHEAPSFYGTGPGDTVYVVRVDAEGAATVLFGDGVHGARLPTGAQNVVASYVFGAGAASPPAGSIKQLAKPAQGLASVSQPADPSGGADAEAAELVRRFGPRSALVLGRAVSIADMNALAAVVPGVRAVQTRWAWQGKEQRPVVQCWFAGTPAAGSVKGRLSAMSDPTTPIAAEPAKALPAVLVLKVEVEAGRVPADVLAQVFQLLAAPDAGFLRVEQLGIGQPLYRSKLTARVLSVPGALAVHFAGMLWLDRAGSLRVWLNSGYGASPGTGCFFDFERGLVHLNGEARRLG